MLEGLVAWVLNNYLGKYVENLNTDQLSVALLSGKVELENLPLKKDALRHLGLPVEIKAGFIGKVQLQVPVRQIRSAPWLIAIEKLYLVATPVNLDEWDAAAEAVFAHERKMALLEGVEAQWRAERDAADAGYYAASYSSWLSYGTGLLANIVENLQLKLSDVHIRFEDSITGGPGEAFACGLTVASLAAESCDSEWRRGFTLLAEPSACSYKLLELRRLALYWDRMPGPEHMLAHCDIPQLTERMSGAHAAPHRRVVWAESAHARVRRERTEQPLRSRARPRLAATLTLDAVQLDLTSRQYAQAVRCGGGLERISRVRELRARRPARPVCGHARDWWLYALASHLPHHRLCRPRPTWQSCAAEARACVQYVGACAAALASPAAALPPPLQAAKDDYEWRTPLHVLRPLREVAMRRVPKPTPVSTPDRPSSGRSMLVHWFPQWWGWYGPPADDPSATPSASDGAPQDLEEEILDVLADSIDDNTLLKRDTVFGKFEFVLNKGSLNLSMDEGDGDTEAGGALQLQFTSLRLRLEARPRAAAHALHAQLGALCLRDAISPRTLFPIICAPQGVIREGLSASGAAAWGRGQATALPQDSEPLFQLSYEKKPFSSNCDYRLWVKSGSMEVVYSAEVAQWVRAFVCAPWAGAAGGGGSPLLAYTAVRDSTRARIMTHWEDIMRAGERGERKSWQVELDISAPQILFAEKFCSREASVLLVDFGRLRVNNVARGAEGAGAEGEGAGEDDEDAFMTPCSTPPGSLLSPADPAHAAALDAARLHDTLYDRYNIELSDLQILVGRVKDNWQYAHTKSTSSLHLLDRFSISLQAERRVVVTLDPQYPSATLRGSLPALVVHLSEHKIAALWAVLGQCTRADYTSTDEPDAGEAPAAEEEASVSSDTERSDLSQHNATMFLLQFAVDQMSLEVQSLGRSIAEVQVRGVRAHCAARARELSLALSVHSLLLVDALQTYGPDFELLVASHKHVGMDTASGSLLDSEPQSPRSPQSPSGAPAPPLDDPYVLSQALYSLHQGGHRKNPSERDRASPIPNRTPGGGAPDADPAWGWAESGGGGYWGAPGLVDSEALIAVELCLVRGDDGEDLRIANILFNNLDIIANQETIVELIGFAQRVMSTAPAAAPPPPPRAPAPSPPLHDNQIQAAAVRTEITFDFHRLGVLLVRAAERAGALVARKVATATLCEARIQATLDGEHISASGSLGGVHVVSLCERGVHTRVLSAGRGAGAEAARADGRALLFAVRRDVRAAPTGARVAVGVSASVARVWYTHSPALTLELRSCLHQFTGYLARLARSIRAAAADMALGLVQPRESVYANPRFSSSTEGVSPRRRTVSLGASLEDCKEFDSDDIELSVDVSLESPVVVAARGPRSTQVVVAHLGRMALTNRPGPPAATAYCVHVRDISLVSLDVAEKLKHTTLTSENMHEIYDASCGKPVLHNTALQLTLDCRDPTSEQPYLCVVSGGVVGALQVSACREQYEQLLDTLAALAHAPAPDERAPAGPQPHGYSRESGAAYPAASEDLDGAVPTLRLDPAVRAAVLAVPPAPPPPAPSAARAPPLLVTLELATLSVELRADLGEGERSLVQLSFREFALSYSRTTPHETTLQVRLHSITMEDLTKAPESRHRTMMASGRPPSPPKAVFVSRSCPDLRARAPRAAGGKGSLPAHLNLIADNENTGPGTGGCGATPPGSPLAEDEVYEEEECRLPPDDNLVRVWVHTRDPEHPRFDDAHNKVSKLTKVEFNCLNLVVSIDSWVAVLDFFGFSAEDPPPAPAEDDARPPESGAEAAGGVSQTEVSVVALSAVVVGARGELCRAGVGRARVRARAAGGARDVRAHVRALVLHDLTPHAPLWRDTLATHAPRALRLHYRRLSAAEASSAGYETSLELDMGPMTYVHTRRFVHELQTFVRDFSLLRRVIAQARLKVSALRARSVVSRGRVCVRCAAPAIVLPVSGRSRAALVAQLARLDVTNAFRRAGDAGTVSTLADPHCPTREMLDVRTVVLESLTLRCARGGGGGGGGGGGAGGGAPLLTAPAHLTLTVELNMSDTHNVPDMTVQGTLTTLECALEPAQYRLVRGVLAHNLGDAVDEPPPPPLHPQLHQEVWTTSSIKLSLQDVRVRLLCAAGGALACVHFIKSRLHLDTYSDMGRDVDLVSQEILVSDTRYAQQPANRRGNVFTNIVQPMPDHRHSVQAEVHARSRHESSAYTILVNNMRLMAVLDWWERAGQFILQPPPPPADPDQPPLEEPYVGRNQSVTASAAEHQMELKLNITDSQLVLVEDASVWDTNAVILRSTTVVTYRPGAVSCSMGEVEVFSCVLGLEDETALAILDPAAAQLQLAADRVLHVSMSTLDLRLSYHDMRMFASMLRSLPLQARAALSGKAPGLGAEEDAPANMRAGSEAARLVGLAPRWLRSAAAPAPAPAPTPAAQPGDGSAMWPLKAVQVTAECITLCVIDDCLDSDVPLLEISLSDLKLDQDLRHPEEGFEDPVLVSTPAGPPAPRVAPAAGGHLEAQLSIDYYNRMLSGWEPFVEPWRFETSWEYTLSSSLSLARVQARVASAEVLNTNVTSSLLALWRLVRATWAADCFAPAAADGSPKGSPQGHRRRSPFVPYALLNHTGHTLWFTTLIATSDALWAEGAGAGGAARPDDSWQAVRAGDTEPFSFGARRARARREPAHALHQLALRLDGWAPPDPVCVDRVGVYFRDITHLESGAAARIVLEVSLEGSARKLVRVRSALQLRNTLPHAVDVRADHAPASGAWRGGGRSAQVAAGGVWAAPLAARAGALWVRPLAGSAPHAAAPVDWRTAHPLIHCASPAPPDNIYRFCCVVQRERFPPERGEAVAGHTLTLVPALRLENLLPLELHYRCAPQQLEGTAPPGDSVPFHQVNVEEGVELSVKLEGFGWSTPLSVGGPAGGGSGGGGGSFTARLKLRDIRGRRLYLNARVTMKKTDGIKVCVSAAYWLVNRTGLPLVFRAEGAAHEAAGQFAEHEVARMVAPLLFALGLPDAGPTLSARLGHALPGSPQWCSPFGLGPGVGVKKLETRGEGEGAERVYAVGVSVRAGRGRYRHTNIATFTPRYQLHNNTGHHLQFAQKCTATTLNDPGAMATHVSAVAGCYLPWQWARWERPHLLCVRLLAPDGSEPRTAWSGGFRIDAARSLHLACREPGGGYQFVRVEVASQGATLFVVFTDADTAPPPLVICNYSPVSIMFHQVGCGEECAVGAHSQTRWALPEPEGAATLALRAPGGPRTQLPLGALGSTALLLYQNFIYVAVGEGPEPPVLEVAAGGTRVRLARRRHGERAQLWRRGPAGQLVHEGSSAPQPTDALPPEDAPLPPHCMVLDIADAAPRPGRASALQLRRADPRRASTQAWRLEGARMRCAHANLCVLPEGAAAPGARLLLALPPRGALAPVAWPTLRPGSGRLALSLTADGPTRRVAIRDREAPEAGRADGAEGGAGGGREWGVAVALGGVSVSLVARAELVYAHFGGVAAQLAREPRALHAALHVQHMQWDNQLLDTASPVLLQCLPPEGEGPALHAAMELTHADTGRYNAYFFKHLCVALRPLAVRLEERLILQLWAWAWAEAGEAREQPDEAEYETRRMLDELTALHATRYYFALIKLMPGQIRLSMRTAARLEPELAALKRRLGLTLIKFEDANVELEPFVRAHVFDTASYLARQMLAHFKDELKWQAAKILGSVDFLGNPLGFVADVSEGVSGLLLEGNVGALLKNVTHGISNSAAKVTESLGDGLERVVGDEAHEETRRRIRSEAGGSHLAAGLRGLSLGLLGGMTSLVKHSYEGAASEGLGGFLAGVGKGLVGTVTKPVIGVLDLAAETAAAVRDTSRRGLRAGAAPPGRARPPRCAAAPAGLLARYCPSRARAAALLHALNGGDRAERVLAYRPVRDAPHDIRALLSDSHLRIFTLKHGQPHVVMETHLSNLVSCTAVSAEGAHYVELGVRGGGGGGAGAGAGEGVRRPRVQCDSAEVAGWVARHAAYARQLYYEHTHTLQPLDDTYLPAGSGPGSGSP